MGLNYGFNLVGKWNFRMIVKYQNEKQFSVSRKIEDRKQGVYGKDIIKIR